MRAQLLKDGGANIYELLGKNVNLKYESHYAYIRYAV